MIIIGLGNPGKKFNDTRHNVGFRLINKLQKEWSLPQFEFNKKFNADISESKSKNLHSKSKMLVKPQTFMNLSGESVRTILDFYKLTPQDIIVIHDDLDINLGKYKIATDSSSAGHNGVQNIIDKLGTQKFIRIRIGVKNETLRFPIDPSEFVLQKFKEKDLEILEEVLDDVVEKLENITLKIKAPVQN